MYGKFYVTLPRSSIFTSMHDVRLLVSVFDNIICNLQDSI